jgi:hypothetical protein
MFHQQLEDIPSWGLHLVTHVDDVMDMLPLSLRNNGMCYSIADSPTSDQVFMRLYGLKGPIVHLYPDND